MSVRPGVKLVHRFRRGVRVVGIVEFRGEIIIATERAMYRMKSPTDKPKKIRLYNYMDECR